MNRSWKRILAALLALVLALQVNAPMKAEAKAVGITNGAVVFIKVGDQYLYENNNDVKVGGYPDEGSRPYFQWVFEQTPDGSYWIKNVGSSDYFCLEEYWNGTALTKDVVLKATSLSDDKKANWGSCKWSVSDDGVIASAWSGSKLYISGDECRFGDGNGTSFTFDDGTVEEHRVYYNSDRYYVSAELVDFLNDNRVEQKLYDYSKNNQGKITYNEPVENRAFTYLNYAISQKASREGWQIPLYFGDLSVPAERYGRALWGVEGKLSLVKWSTDANVAIRTGEGASATYDTVAQGLVGVHLVDGKLTDPANAAVLPFMSGENLYAVNSAGVEQTDYPVTQYYKKLRFPFEKTVDAKGVITYSYDSLNDYAVYYDYEKKTLYESDQYVYNENAEEGNKRNGFYPFNRPGDSGDAINFGFGTKFTIPFKLGADGKINGEKIKFEFTGDDDVWVFIDGHLVLDMGGGHRRAHGEINFADRVVTVNHAMTPGGRDALDEVCSSGSFVRDSSVGYFESASKEFNKIDCGDQNFEQIMNADDNTHVLTMFYMERGMHDSNMSISFNMEVIPSGLSVLADLDTANVNPGLRELVKDAAAFDFQILKNGSNTISSTETTYRQGDDEVITLTDGKITGLPVGVTAYEFKTTPDAEGDDSAFRPGDTLTVTEQNADSYNTTCEVFDVKKGGAKLGDSVAVFNPENKTMAFDFGAAGMASADYLVHFMNTRKVGNVKATLQWDGEKNPQSFVDTQEFAFVVEVDAKGDGNFVPWKNLAYDSDQGATRNGASDENGVFNMKVGETVTFWGVPTGVSVRVRELTAEQEKYNEYWNEVNTGTAATTHPVTTDNAETLVIKNRSLFYQVFYVEAGKPADLPVLEKETRNTAAEATGSGHESVAVTTDSVSGKVTFASDSKSVVNEKYTFERYITETENNNTEKLFGKVTVFTYRAEEDVYVFDYGLKSDLANAGQGNGMFANDILFNQYDTTTTAEFIGLKKDLTDEDAVWTNKAELEQSDIEATVIPKEIKPLTDNGEEDGKRLNGGWMKDASVVFAPKAFMDKVETFYYQANVYAKDKSSIETPADGVQLIGTVKVMPASIVYYEDNFGDVMYDGTFKNNTHVDIMQSNNQSEAYGHDDAYANRSDNDSLGGTTEMSPRASAYFEFVGTGFELVCRTARDAGNMTVIVYNQNVTLTQDPGTQEVTLENAKIDNIERIIPVSTYFENGELYQIPVIHVDGLTHGRYVVRIVANRSPVDAKRSTVYLDGIRIFNPLTDAQIGDYIESEKNAKVINVKEAILGEGYEFNYENPVDSTAGTPMISMIGSVAGNTAYLAGKTVVESYRVDKKPDSAGYVEYTDVANDLMTYAVQGPNNELYLDPGYGIAFTAEKSEEATSCTLQIGMKVLDGSVKLEKKAAGGAWQEWMTLSSKTENYYELGEEAGEYAIRVSTQADAPAGRLSITGLKVKNFTLAPVTVDGSGSNDGQEDTNLKPADVMKKSSSTRVVPGEESGTTMVVTDAIFTCKTAEAVENFKIYKHGSNTEVAIVSKSYKTVSDQKVWVIRYRVDKECNAYDVVALDANGNYSAAVEIK